MTNLGNHEIDEGLGTRHLFSQRSCSFAQDHTGEKSEEFPSATIVNSCEFVTKSGESALFAIFMSIDTDEMPGQLWRVQQNQDLGFFIKSLFESDSINFFFVSSFILMNNLLWNMGTRIVEFGPIYDSIMSVLRPF
jgi:hypothetical protein